MMIDGKTSVASCTRKLIVRNIFHKPRFPLFSNRIGVLAIIVSFRQIQKLHLKAAIKQLIRCTITVISKAADWFFVSDWGYQRYREMVPYSFISTKKFPSNELSGTMKDREGERGIWSKEEEESFSQIWKREIPGYLIVPSVKVY